MKITKELQKSRKKYVRVSKAVAKTIRQRYKSYSEASQELQIPISSVRRILSGKQVSMEHDRYRLIRENLKGTQRFSLENRFVILARTPANFGDYATRVNLTAKVLDILEPYVYTKNGESEFFKSDPLWSSLLDFVVAAKNVRETLNFLHSRFPQYDDLFFGGTRFAERYDAYVTRHYKPKDPPQKRIQSENIDSKQEEVCTMQIKLRDGTVAPFDRNRITVAIKKALAACDMVSDMVALRVTEDVVSECRNQEVVDQEEIQDRVEEALMKRGLFKVARAYIVYRRDHSIFRGDAIGFFNGFLEKLSAINVDNQNANVDGHSFGGRMGEAASYVCKQAALDFKMSDTARDNHVNNIIYVHDLDHMYVGDHNCLSMPLDSLLANGFTTRQTDIRGAQSVGTAMQLVAVLFQLQSLQQFGGVAATHLDYTMVPFVRKSFKKQCLRVAFREFVYGYGEEMNATLTPELLAYVNKYPIVDEWFSLDKETIKDIEKVFAPWYMGYLKMTDDDFTFSSDKLPRRVRNEAHYYTAEETRQAVEALMHNLNSLQSRSGCQLPFTSVNFGTCTEPEGRLVSELVLKAYIKGTGPHGSTPIFPCGIFVLKKGVNEAPGDPNYDLFQLALKSTALRLYPNYANGDWSAQVSWFKMDREMKRRVLDEVSEGDKELLLQALESKPELLKKLTLEIKDNNLEVSEVEQPTEQMSTMGALAGQEHLYVKLGANIYDMPIRALFKYCRDGVLEEARPCQIFFNKDELHNKANRHEQQKSGIKVGAGVYAVTYIPEDVTYIGSSANVNRRLTEHRSLIKRSGKLDAGPCFGDSDLSHYKFEILEYTDDYEEAEARYIERIPNVNYRGVTHQYYKVPSQANRDVFERPTFKQDLTRKQELIDIQAQDIKVLDRDNRWVKVKHIFKNDKFNTPNMMHVYYVQQGRTYHLACTEDHPLWTGTTFTEAAQIKPGDHLYRADGLELTVTKTTWFYDRQDSYDIGTETGTFIGSDIIMHNCRTMNGFDLWAEDSYRKALHDVIATGDTTVDILSAVQKDGRGNICPVTIILPEVAMLAERDIDKFMSLLALKIEEAKDMLLERFNWIASQPKESAKFMYGNHTMGGYIPGEGIISALRHGTIVIGQLGLAEALQLLIGKDHTTEEGMQLAKRIEQLFKDKIAEFRKQYKMNFGVYYTPAENLCYTALTKFRKKHGIIPNVSDKSFFTNSMHVPVWRRMNPFEKIDIESQLTSYSSAGCITYTELDVSVKNNLEALEQLVLYAMQKDIPYFAVNVPNDHCRDCGYIGEIPAECPKCGSQQVTRLRRVTGYLSQDYHNFNAGKVDEVEHRVKHIG